MAFICILRLAGKYNDPRQLTPEVMQTLEEHSSYLQKLGQKGSLIVAGRTDFDPGDPRLFGLILFKADSKEEVEAFRNNDPAFAKGVQLWEILPFRDAIAFYGNGLS